MRFSYISIGPLFEWLYPAIWIISACLSARTLADARALRFNVYEIAAWTLGAFFLPFIILPLYLIARAARRRNETKISNSTMIDAEDETVTADEESSPPAIRGGNPTVREGALPKASAPSLTVGFLPSPPDAQLRAAIRWRRTLPALYLTLILSIIGLYFYNDYESADAHFMRGNFDKLRGRHTEAIREYAAALRLEPDNAHTHKLIAEEYAAMERWNEALEYFRAAESKGEMDDALPFRIATTLDMLNRLDESVREYERFLNGHCAGRADDARCDAARRRVNE